MCMSIRTPRLESSGSTATQAGRSSRAYASCGLNLTVGLTAALG